MNYWLVKQEPEDYSWADFLKDGRTAWTGVRNFQARNNLRAMKQGDLVFFYESGEHKQVVGLTRVEKRAYADPTADEGDWVCVNLVPVQTLAKTVALNVIKSDKLLREMTLIKQSRLSVVPVTLPQARRLLSLSEARMD